MKKSSQIAASILLQFAQSAKKCEKTNGGDIYISVKKIYEVMTEEEYLNFIEFVIKFDIKNDITNYL